MGTIITYATLDGCLESTGEWEDARNSNTGSTHTGSLRNGFWNGIFQSFLQFDTSELAPIPDVVTSARMNTVTSESAVFYSIAHRARIYDWGSELNNTDFVPADDLESLPLFNTKGQYGTLWSTSSGHAELINRTGITHLMTHTNDQLGSEPEDPNNFQGWYRRTHSDPENHPYMQIEHGGIPDASLVSGMSEGVFVSSGGKRYLIARVSGSTSELGAWINIDDG